MIKCFLHQNLKIFFIDNILQDHAKSQGYFYKAIITP